MQRIKTVRWPARNIGGDRAFTKLRYTIGNDFGIPSGSFSNFQNLAMNVGAYNTGGGSTLQGCSINGVLGSTPGLSTMGLLYQKYRIRGIKLKMTYWQIAGAPVILYTNAQSDIETLGPSKAGPVPGFITPTITTIPEQRWCKYRVCSQTQNGGKPTSLTSYYSVNKVFGPDDIVKNDEDYTGETQVATPYWNNQVPAGSNSYQPSRTPWIQFGLTTLNGAVTTASTAVTGVLKVEATVYTEFFGKRALTE